MKKGYGKILGLGIVALMIIVCLVFVIKNSSKEQTVNNDITEETEVTETTESTETTEATEEGDVLIENGQENSENEQTDISVDDNDSESQFQSEQSANTTEVPFDMANPIQDSEYTGIVAYEAKQVLTNETGLSNAEVKVTMPQLTMRSMEAGKINEELLAFYTKEFEIGLSGAGDDIEYQNGIDKEEEEPIHYDYSYETGYQVTFMNEKYVSILANGYEYAGGAHGMPVRTDLIFNLETGERVSGDTLFALSDEQVQTLKVEAYKELFAQSEEGEYWEDAISIVEDVSEETGQYYLTDEGVTFYYHPYTLAPYAAGFVEVTVPYEKMPLK